MCDTTKNGYQSKSGVNVELKPNIKLDEIPVSVREELQKANASQLDLLVMRSEMRENSQELKKIKGVTLNHQRAIEDLNGKFYVTVKNGSENRIHISELILNMYERETNRRHLTYFMNLLSRHKKLVYFLLTCFFLINLGFHNYIRDAFSWMSGNILEIMKIIF